MFYVHMYISKHMKCNFLTLRYFLFRHKQLKYKKQPNNLRRPLLKNVPNQKQSQRNKIFYVFKYDIVCSYENKIELK